MKYPRSVLYLLTLLFFSNVYAQQTDTKKPCGVFPNFCEPEPIPSQLDGKLRYTIDLPDMPLQQWKEWKVEILAGRYLSFDGYNGVRLVGTLNELLTSDGVNKYYVAEFEHIASTLLGVPQHAPRVQKFFWVPSLTIDYYPREPIVVFVPNDWEVHYRLWKLTDIVEQAEKNE